MFHVSLQLVHILCSDTVRHTMSSVLSHTHKSSNNIVHQVIRWDVNLLPRGYGFTNGNVVLNIKTLSSLNQSVRLKLTYVQGDLDDVGFMIIDVGLKKKCARSFKSRKIFMKYNCLI